MCVCPFVLSCKAPRKNKTHDVYTSNGFDLSISLSHTYTSLILLFYNMSAMFPQVASISGGFSFPDASSVMGGWRGKVGLHQNRFSADGGSVLRNAGLPPGSVFDVNNPVNGPFANVPVVVPWAIDAKQRRHDISAGQMVFSCEDPPNKSQFMEPDKQPHWFKSPGALNHYLGTPEAHKLYKDVDIGFEMATAWPFQGIAWTKQDPEESATNSTSQVYNFEVNGTSETHDYWYYNRYFDEAGNMKGGVFPFDHLFWIWSRQLRYSFEDLGDANDFGFKFMDPKDRYQWQVAPYCQSGGYELTVDINRFGDLNTSSENQHHAHGVHVGVCTEYINRYESHSMGMEVAKACLFPKEVNDSCIKAFNILPHIQVMLGGL